MQSLKPQDNLQEDSLLKASNALDTSSLPPDILEHLDYINNTNIIIQDLLKEAILNLHQLLELTEKDIEDIKKANNDAIFARASLKTKHMKRFEDKKSQIDKQMLSIMKLSQDVELSKLLSQATSNLLGDLRKALEELKKINTSYARMAFAVSEFYTSLKERLIPKEKADFKSSTAKHQILRLQV